MNAVRITEKQIQKGLTRIARARPVINRLMETRVAGQVVRVAWADILRAVPSASIYDAVVNDMVLGRMAFVAKGETDDMLPYSILAECRRRYAKEQQKAEAVLNRTRPTGAMAYVRRLGVGRQSLLLAEQKQAGHLTAEEHDRRLEELLNHEFRNGPLPAWLSEEPDQAT